MPKIKESVELYPFGHNCNKLEGEVSVETYNYLIESGKATPEDFESELEPKAKTKKANK